MRKKILTFWSILAFGSINAQNINTPPSANPSAFAAGRPATFEEYLVNLAVTNSPEIEGSKYEVDARKEEIDLAKKEWTRNLQAGLNFNDVSFPYFVHYNLGIDSIGGRGIDTNRFSRIATYPLWNVGLSVNIGDLMTRKSKIRIADDKRKIAETDMSRKKMRIRAEVLARYQAFLGANEIYKVRLQALDAAETAKIQIDDLFKVGKVKIEDYNEAKKAYFSALEGKVTAEIDIKVKKYALEELIGTKWETVERIKDSYNK